MEHKDVLLVLSAYAVDAANALDNSRDVEGVVNGYVLAVALEIETLCGRAR